MAEPEATSKVMLCSECFAELREGSCSEHPDDPPLDPAIPEVRDILEDADDRALARLQRKLMGIGAIPGVLTVFGMGGFMLATGVWIPRIIFGGVFVAVTFAGLTIGRRWANRRFKPRYTCWTGRDYKMDEGIEEMIRETHGP